MSVFPHPTAEQEWQVHLPAGCRLDATQRARLVEAMRPELQQRLAEDPTLRLLCLPTPAGSARLERITEGDARGGRIKLVFAPDTPPLATGAAEAGYRQIALPDERLLALSHRLVGLERIREAMVLRICCAQERVLDRWTERAPGPATAQLRRYLREHASVFVLVGDPGVGKTALAQVTADQACRQAGVTGTLLSVGTEVRGNGLVGDLSARLSSAFAALAAAPGSLKALLLDEADAVAVRRSEYQLHHEDRVGAATIIQCIDRMGSLPGSVLFLTSNLEAQIDAAIRRRATIYRMDRPGSDARQVLLRRWLPTIGLLDLKRAIAASRGMTAADLENCLTSVHLVAMKEDRRVTAREVIAALKSGERTGSV